jgi:hypothetical protein
LPENRTPWVIGELDALGPGWVAGEQDALGPWWVAEDRDTTEGRERRATEGEKEREWRGILDDGSPGLREKWEREGENEWDERNGGK